VVDDRLAVVAIATPLVGGESCVDGFQTDIGQVERECGDDLVEVSPLFALLS
jgi:hypothetical protein